MLVSCFTTTVSPRLLVSALSSLIYISMGESLILVGFKLLSELSKEVLVAYVFKLSKYATEADQPGLSSFIRSDAIKERT